MCTSRPLSDAHLKPHGHPGPESLNNIVDNYNYTYWHLSELSWANQVHTCAHHVSQCTRGILINVLLNHFLAAEAAASLFATVAFNSCSKGDDCDVVEREAEMWEEGVEMASDVTGTGTADLSVAIVVASTAWVIGLAWDALESTMGWKVADEEEVEEEEEEETEEREATSGCTSTCGGGGGGGGDGGDGGGFLFGTPGILIAVESGRENISSEENLWEEIGEERESQLWIYCYYSNTYRLTVSQYCPGKRATGYLELVL